MNVKHTILPHHNWSWRRGLWASYVRWLKATSWPILVGPWHGEVGFEVLYWIPFIERLKKAGIAPERLIPISRGGAAEWYGCPQGLELYAMRTPQQVRIENRLQHEKTGLLKQVGITPFDQQILRDAAETMKLTRYHVLHPAWMYHGLAPFWVGQRGPNWLAKRAHFPTIQAPELPSGLELPEVFVAARFYARETWPPQEKAVKQATEMTLRKLADQHPVVILESETVADEHMDYPIPRHENLIRLRDLTKLVPETNLAVQSAVLARAQGFVGTYGGFAQLALRLGKPSVSFYHQWVGTAITHLVLSEELASQSSLAFAAIKLGQIPMLLSVLPAGEIRVVGKVLDTRKDLTPAVVGVD